MESGAGGPGLGWQRGLAAERCPGAELPRAGRRHRARGCCPLPGHGLRWRALILRRESSGGGWPRAAAAPSGCGRRRRAAEAPARRIPGLSLTQWDDSSRVNHPGQRRAADGQRRDWGAQGQWEAGSRINPGCIPASPLEEHRAEALAPRILSMGQDVCVSRNCRAAGCGLSNIGGMHPRESG